MIFILFLVCAETHACAVYCACCGCEKTMKREEDCGTLITDIDGSHGHGLTPLRKLQVHGR